MSVASGKFESLIRTGLDRVMAAASDRQVVLPDDELFSKRLRRVIACSDYLTEVMSRYPDWLAELQAGGDFERAADPVALRHRLQEPLSKAGEQERSRVLRLFRHREMLRILWRDLNGLADLDATLADLTALADICLAVSVEVAYAEACQRWGTPRDGQGDAQGLVVLGMGKLGARELNVSSDIDLILAYPRDGVTDGDHALSNEVFFRRLGQQLVGLVGEPTEDGFVFRVDLRLRPHGDGGRLALSFAAMEEYYQREGRDWERYALVKARPVAGDLDAGERLLTTLKPFVYRRYLDYSAFEALREMKALVAAEVSRRGLENNIKLGRGGIREIEFVVQAFQLIHGGKDSALCERGLRTALNRLVDRELVSAATRDRLDQAYVYLRRLENALQALNDQQTHELPADPLARARIALSMNEDSWSDLCAHLDAHRDAVSAAFEPILAGPEDDADDAAWVALWHGRVDAGQADTELAAAGFVNPAAARDALDGLVRAVKGRVSARARKRVDQFVPHLLGRVAAGPVPDETLKRVLAVVESVARRSAYINLLLENPAALDKLIQLSRESAWLAEILARQPVLLDELLHPAHLYEQNDRDQLAELLEQRLATGQGLEEEMDLLRQFKRSQVMRIAAQDLDGRLDASQMAARLVDVAEVTLDQALNLAWRDLVAQHGQPRDANGQQPGLAIIAYGRLGGRELGYGSDLDLVFLHDARAAGMTDGRRPVDNARFFVRLAQRLVHILTTRTPSGRLYAVDARLRPGGTSGLLVISFDAYSGYQLHEAWTWEHQALVRARWVGGHHPMAGTFEELRRQVLGQERDAEKLLADVRDMRGRMRRELGRTAAGEFDIKQSHGGLVDIEFIAQCETLRWAHSNPELLETTTTLGLLQGLSTAGRLDAADAVLLQDAWRSYTARMNRLQLQNQPARLPEAEVAGWAGPVSEVWSRIIGENPA